MRIAKNRDQNSAIGDSMKGPAGTGAALPGRTINTQPP